MQKRLSPIGNGLALFIDKSLQQLLRIDRDTVLRLETDGLRLIVEPVGQCERPRKVTLEPWMNPGFLRSIDTGDEEEARAGYFAAEICSELSTGGFTNEHFRRLYQGHSGRSFELFWSFQRHPESFVYTTHVRHSILRLQAALHAQKHGADWEQAIEASLESVPFLASEER